jgi:hypothetical protein
LQEVITYMKDNLLKDVPEHNGPSKDVSFDEL